MVENHNVTFGFILFIYIFICGCEETMLHSERMSENFQVIVSAEFRRDVCVLSNNLKIF